MLLILFASCFIGKSRQVMLKVYCFISHGHYQKTLLPSSVYYFFWLTYTRVLEISMERAIKSYLYLFAEFCFYKNEQVFVCISFQWPRGKQQRIVNVLLGKYYTDFAQILEKQLYIIYRSKYSAT